MAVPYKRSEWQAADLATPEAAERFLKQAAAGDEGTREVARQLVCGEELGVKINLVLSENELALETLIRQSAGSDGSFAS